MQHRKKSDQGGMPKLVFNYANKYLHVTFVFDDSQHFSAPKGFKHLLYNVFESVGVFTPVYVLP